MEWTHFTDLINFNGVYIWYSKFTKQAANRVQLTTWCIWNQVMSTTRRTGHCFHIHHVTSQFRNLRQSKNIVTLDMRISSDYSTLGIGGYWHRHTDLGYADDTDLLTESEKSLQQAVGRFLQVSKRMAMKINAVKTETQWLGHTGWLKIKYPTRQYAISSQPVVRFLKFLKLSHRDTSLLLSSRVLYFEPPCRYRRFKIEPEGQ